MLFWSGLAIWKNRLGLGIAWWAASTTLKIWTVLFWPWWFLEGKRRALLSSIWLLFLGGTTIGYFAISPESLSRVYGVSAEKRWAGGMDDLYWGRQGVQMIAPALFSKGLLPDQRNDSKANGLSQESQSKTRPLDIAAWANLALSVTSLGMIFLLILFRRRTAHPLDLFSLVWLWWFFGYLDTWEHHYVMLLPWLALMGLAKRLPRWSLWLAALLWATPSLWLIAGWAVRTSHFSAQLWVIFYFLHRPVVLLGMFGWIAGRCWKKTTFESENEKFT